MARAVADVQDVQVNAVTNFGQIFRAPLSRLSIIWTSPPSWSRVRTSVEPINPAPQHYHVFFHAGFGCHFLISI